MNIVLAEIILNVYQYEAMSNDKNYKNFNQIQGVSSKFYVGLGLVGIRIKDRIRLVRVSSKVQ